MQEKIVFQSGAAGYRGQGPFYAFSGNWPTGAPAYPRHPGACLPRNPVPTSDPLHPKLVLKQPESLEREKEVMSFVRESGHSLQDQAAFCG
jgi:hypothetical protein